MTNIEGYKVSEGEVNLVSPMICQKFSSKNELCGTCMCVMWMALMKCFQLSFEELKMTSTGNTRPL